MHHSALFLTLATVAISASTRVNVDINQKAASTNNEASTTSATVNFLNSAVLATRNVDINLLANVDTDNKPTAHHPITVELGKRLNVNVDPNVNNEEDKSVNAELSRHVGISADLLKQDQPVSVNVGKRLDVDVLCQEHKLINVDLNRRLDSSADLLRQDKPVSVNVDKRLDLNVLNHEHKLINVDLSKRLDIDVLNQEHKLINVDLGKRLDFDILSPEYKLISVNFDRRLDAHFLPDSNTPAIAHIQPGDSQTVNVNLARGRMLTAVEVNRRLDINANLLKQDRPIDIDAQTSQQSEPTHVIHVKKRVDLNINDILAKEHKLITVDLGKRLDLNIDTSLNKEHKLITVDLGKGKRHMEMSTGYVLDTVKVDGQVAGSKRKRDFNVSVKSDHRLSARRNKDEGDDWEDDDDKEGENLNESGSSVKDNNNKKDAEKKKEPTPTTDEKKKDTKSEEATGEKKNAASRSSAFAGLSIVGLLVGSAFLWA
ncbi:hypothetical protein BGX33_006926 [Mortierella sp. NVP41]|nr:hypothetical protein BGX33_006926 [Mortierella sp. NVP41]